MQIVKNTGDQLIVRQSSTTQRVMTGVFLAAILSGLLPQVDQHLLWSEEQMLSTVVLLSLGGLSFIYILFAETTLWQFDRSNQSLVIQNKRLFFLTSTKYELQEIERVEIVKRQSESGDAFTIRLKFTHKQQCDLSSGYHLSEINARDGAHHISTFLGIQPILP